MKKSLSNLPTRAVRKLERKARPILKKKPALDTFLFPPDTLLKKGRLTSGPNLVHIGYITRGNAGDTLLSTVVRDVVENHVGGANWQTIQAHAVVGAAELDIINKSQGVVIGGGGLFLKDTNPNQNSGWQWNCSLEALRKIQAPLSIFAVGYNRFRGQSDFEPIFHQHLRETVEKSVFFGLRNHGSIRAIRSYLPDHLQEKVQFQPCMTTVLTRLYPHLFQDRITDAPFIALNCAFDRAELRFKDGEDQSLDQIGAAMKRLSARLPIKYYSHVAADEKFLSVLEKHEVPFELVKLYNVGPEVVVEAFRKPALTIGMRGHAQMIPFGCQRPILSLISHDKMQWFLDDINATEWGVEVQQEHLADRIVETAEHILNNQSRVQEQLDLAQKRLWDITTANLEVMKQAFLKAGHA